VLKLSAIDDKKAQASVFLFSDAFALFYTERRVQIDDDG